MRRAPAEPLVSVCLPVRNGERRLAEVIRSVLSQDHPHLELVISDNASTDGTEEICRELARHDDRIVYHRQRDGVGLLDNFVAAMRRARGVYLRWIGDGDTLHPAYVSRCVAAFAEDERRVLVTTQICYVSPDGTTRTGTYDGTGLASADPSVRFAEILRLLNESYLVIDPLYGMMRRATVAALPRVNSYREDQLLAARLALAGPWGHIPEPLAWRVRDDSERPREVARKLGLPTWQVYVSTVLLCRDLLRHVADSDLGAAGRRRARAQVARFYLRRHRLVAARRLGRLRRLLGSARPVRGPVVRPPSARPR